MRTEVLIRTTAVLAALTVGLTAGLLPASAAPGPAPDSGAASPARPSAPATSTPKGDVSGSRPTASASAPTGTRIIPGRYIVRFRDDVGVSAAATAMTTPGVGVVRTYSSSFRGAVVRAQPAVAAELARDPRVHSVEPDQIIHTSDDAIDGEDVSTTATQRGATWGLDRSDQRARRLSGGYSYPATGRGVTAYVVDTGIRATHAGFGSRVLRGHSSVRDGRGTRDCNGHGTHVAGTIGGARFGMAKRVTLVPVRVLDCYGSGSLSTVLEGLDWMVRHHRSGTPAVANLSLGGGPSSALDAAVRALIADGVTAVVAAGNEAWDACDISPARVPAALTVGASMRSDAEAYWSNYGTCIDLFAPGDGITSAWHTSSTARQTLSGTSMAAPHVAGAAAVLLSQRPAWSPAQVSSSLVADATTGVVTARGPGSPDRLLYASPTGPTPPPANDRFAAPTSLPLTGGSSLTGVNRRATKQAGEPRHAGDRGGHSVWWRFRAATSGTVTLSTEGSDFDTLLAVYTGSSVGALTSVASNDDAGNGRHSRVSFPVVAGRTYRVAVDGYSGASGSIRLGSAFAASPPSPRSPVNDAFASATTLSLAATPARGSNAGATRQAGEPRHAGDGGGHSVWWRFTAATSGTVALSTRGSSFDTLLAVYTGGSVGALTSVASNDEDGAGHHSRVSFPVVAGTTYRVAVDGYGGATGSIRLGSAFTASPPSPPSPVNDAFASATTLSRTATGSNLRATVEAGEPRHAGNSGGKSVWWRVTPAASGTVTLSTDGSSFDTLLAVYTGSSVGALTWVASDDDTGAGVQSRVSFPVVAGTTYRVAVDGYGGATGSIRLGSAFTASPPSPPSPPSPTSPVNDAFASATTLSPTATTPSTGSNLRATVEAGEPRHAGNSGGKSVWWRVTPAASGTVTLSTDGSSFDTLLAVYTGDSVAGLTWVASDDDSGAGLQSHVSFPVVAGTTYRVAVDGYGGATGSIALEFAGPS